MSGFTTSGRLAIPICVTRPNGFAFATADVFAFPGFDDRVTPSPPGRLHGERAIAMVSTFQLTRSTKLRLTHQMDTDKFWEGGKIKPGLLMP